MSAEPQGRIFPGFANAWINTRLVLNNMPLGQSCRVSWAASKDSESSKGYKLGLASVIVNLEDGLRALSSRRTVYARTKY